MADTPAFCKTRQPGDTLVHKAYFQYSGYIRAWKSVFYGVPVYPAENNWNGRVFIVRDNNIFRCVVIRRDYDVRSPLIDLLLYCQRGLFLVFLSMIALAVHIYYFEFGLAFRCCLCGIDKF
ncbi:hypothetical protein SDC9_200580 [bioreactor metagenome]|uniref:Uncharacterized protein n=1 Tax=bioreactor metagenome TaxID=1076179 RepID=A0A645INV1_9ZZZZ